MPDFTLSTSGPAFPRNAHNVAFWAKLTGYDGSKFFAWTEYTPTGNPSPGSMSVTDNPKQGTLTEYPAFDPNGEMGAADVGKYVRLQRGYLDVTYNWVYAVLAGGSGGPQPTLNLTLASASNSNVDIGDLSGGYKWVRVVSSPANPTSISSFLQGSDGDLIEVTNCTSNDLELVDGSDIFCPSSLDGNPTYNLLHPRESVFLKYDGTASAWRVLAWQPHVITSTTVPVSSLTTELARRRIKFVPCCYMGVWLTDDATTDTSIVTIGTQGMTTTVQVVTAVSPSTTTATLHFVCGQLVNVTTP